MNDTELKQEASKVTELLSGKEVKSIYRNRPQEICIEFEDGTRLFVDAKESHIELSVTGL